MKVRQLVAACAAGLVLWATGFGAAVVLSDVLTGQDEDVQPHCPTDSTPCKVSPTSVQVPCPTEDSCELDYRDGAWHITPTVP